MAKVMVVGAKSNLSVLLSQNGYEVQGFDHVEAAAENLNHSLYHALICDASEGCTQFFGLIQTFQSKVKGGLTVVVACSDSSENIHRLLQIGVSYLLPTIKEVSTLIQLLRSQPQIDLDTKTSSPNDVNEVFPEIESEDTVSSSQSEIQIEQNDADSISQSLDVENKTLLGSILIVDDDRFVLKTMSYFLSKHGYQVDTLMNAKEIHGFMQVGCYDVILMDFNMPGINGADMIRELKSHYGEVFVVGITAAFEQDVIDEFLKAGAFTVLKKPFETKRLLQMLSKLHLHSKSKTKTNLKVDSLKEVQNWIRSLRLVIVAALFMAFLMWFVEDRIQSRSVDVSPQNSTENLANPIPDQDRVVIEDLKEELLKDLKEQFRNRP